MFLQGKTNQEKAQIALSNRLFVNQWSLHDDLRDIHEGCQSNYNVEIYYCDQKPVGVIVFNDQEFIGIFVKKAYRRLGIGSKMVQFAQTKQKNIQEAFWGVYGSEHFWTSVGFEVNTW